MARELAVLDERADRLAARYWPGPLTLVFPLRRQPRSSPRSPRACRRWRCACPTTRRCSACSPSSLCRSPRPRPTAAARSARPRPSTSPIRSAPRSTRSSTAALRARRRIDDRRAARRRRVAAVASRPDRRGRAGAAARAGDAARGRSASRRRASSRGTIRRASRCGSARARPAADEFLIGFGAGRRRLLAVGDGRPRAGGRAPLRLPARSRGVSRSRASPSRPFPTKASARRSTTG